MATNRPEDGGPAFPQPISYTPSGDREFPGDYGLAGASLRDWLAGQVVAGWGEGHHGATFAMRGDDFPSEGGHAEQYAARMARFSYMVADAMIRARALTGTPEGGTE